MILSSSLSQIVVRMGWAMLKRGSKSASHAKGSTIISFEKIKDKLNVLAVLLL
jgi:hypothetical protein